MSNYTFQLYEKIDGNNAVSLNVKVTSVKSLQLIARNYIDTRVQEQIFVKPYLDGVEIDELIRPLSDFVK